MPRKYLILAVIVPLLVIADQIAKYVAVEELTYSRGEASAGFWEDLGAFYSPARPRPKPEVSVLDNFWHWKYVENTGSAFGFLAGAAAAFRLPFFLVVSIIAMGLIGYLFRKLEPTQLRMQITLSLILGGALGNFIDRAARGYVVDFIDWHWFDGPHWPTFNVADSAITVGVVLLAIDLWRPRPPAPAAEATGPAGPPLEPGES